MMPRGKYGAPNIYTWNTQGNMNAQNKRARLGQWGALSNNQHSILMIQEGGVKQPTGQQGNMYVTAGQAVGAFNERCTNYIASNRPPDETVVLQNPNGSLVIGGGVAGRMPVAVAFDDTLYISFHSIASSSDHDTAELIHALQRNPVYLDYNWVIIGGDFNSDPTSIERILNQGTSRSKSQNSFPHAEVINSRNVTHPSTGNELDFFVMLSKTDFNTPQAQVLSATDPSGDRASDHDGVKTTLPE